MKPLSFDQFIIEVGLKEGQKFNSCHNPPGPGGGQFCSPASTGGGGQSISKVSNSENIANAKKKFSKVLNIQDENSAAVQKHLSDLNLVPDSIVKKMGQKVTIHLGDKPITELDGNQSFKGVQPRGWPPGSTWDQVGGSYNGIKNTVSVGFEKGGGSISSALHEYGHAVQSKIMTTKQYKKLGDAHAKVFNQLPSYLQQGGPRGIGTSEFWAEGFAATLKDRNRAIREYGIDFVSLVDEVTGQ